MPDIEFRSEPKALAPTGPTKFHITKVGYSTNPKSHNDYFNLTFIDLRTGIEVRDTAYVTPGAIWKIEALVRSVGLSLPDGPFKATIDDFENRCGYGSLKHRELKSGKVVAELDRVWTREQAIAQDPSLADIEDPSGVITETYTLPLTRKAAAAKAAAAAAATGVPAGATAAAPTKAATPATTAPDDNEPREIPF